MIDLTEEYLTTEPEELAKKLSGKEMSTQMRKFYDDFKILEKRLDTLPDKGQERETIFKTGILPLIKFSKAKVAYNFARALFPQIFKTEIDRQIDRIKTEKDFRNFMLYYQALIGFYKYYHTMKEAEQKSHRGRQQRYDNTHGYSRGGRR